MKSIKTSMSARLAALLFGAALFGLVSQGTLAAPMGTPAGTTINNAASLSYTVGGVAQTAVPSNTATFLVSNKVDMTVSKNDLTIVTAVSGSAPQTTGNTSFTVTNVGNNTQVFGLTASALASGTANPFGGPVSTFALTSCSIASVSFPASGSYTTGGGGTYPNYISGLVSGDSATVNLTCVVPANQADGDTAVDQLLANPSTAAGAALLTSTAGAANPALVQTVVRTSAASATDAYLVQTAKLAVAKAVSVLCDPVNGSTNPKYIPGAYVQYAITIANSGSAAATLSQVTDALQVANLSFDPGLISGVGGFANCTAGVGSQAGAGAGFGAIKGAGLVTGYAAPGPGNASQAVTAGADFNVTTPNQVTINFPTLAGTAIGAAGTNTTLNANSYITVFFNTFVK